jgi:ferredoxin
MATVITSECINCGACEPECPNTAIYQGGVEWELNGLKHPAIAQDIFYIVPDKCTECAGFFDHEACAAVCPVDCCVPDPQIPETEEVLIARARVLHADKTFPADAPSRFRKSAGAAPPPETSPAPVLKVAPAPAEPKSVAPPAAPVAFKPAPTEASPEPAAAAPKPVVTAEKPTASAVAPAAPAAPKPAPAAPAAAAPAPARKPGDSFPTELPGSFEEAVAQLGLARSDLSSSFKARLWLFQPILGALSESQKTAMEEGIGDRHCFAAGRATTLNVVLNLLVYPVAALAIGASALNRVALSRQWVVFLALGFAVAAVEATIRLREGVLHGLPPAQWRCRGSWYGWLMAKLVAPFTRGLEPIATQGRIAVDGFHGGVFADKLERERRYGQVYSLTEQGNGYLLHFEFPRQVPPSAVKEQFSLPDEMPDYDYELSFRNGSFVVKGHVVDKNLRRLAAVSPGFPPDFTTDVELPKPANAFKHRLRNKTLEVVLLRR